MRFSGTREAPGADGTLLNPRSLHAQVNIVQRDRAAATELTFQRRRFTCDRGDLLTQPVPALPLSVPSLFLTLGLCVCTHTTNQDVVCAYARYSPPYGYSSCLPNHPPIYACECVALCRAAGPRSSYVLFLLLFTPLPLSTSPLGFQPQPLLPFRISSLLSILLSILSSILLAVLKLLTPSIQPFLSSFFWIFKHSIGHSATDSCFLVVSDLL